ncbi:MULTISPECIES: hypothetical protein [Ramlibacter]|uniref:Uncharacterized protein n=1 Tax=Ramlibacter pinisoli TaxID=2682844 RepID=A0A6N8IXY8_9BURK|nr:MULTISPECIES: hypothetical protein [Ramlibacter]MBA2961755.1 hypothetical protein [Ramlibacter sp. CGMCC 1.13660]MVQ31697.1 hypothetical protein [Ramlibacter pinisoli]
MNMPVSKWTVAWWAALILASCLLTPGAEAQRRGGGGGAAGARAGAGGGAPRGDARSTDVRSTSVNNVNVQGNVYVDCRGRCGGWDHPVAAAAVVAGTAAVTAAAVGSMVATVPVSCVPVNYGGMFYQECGGTWYLLQGSEYVVVYPPY